MSKNNTKKTIKSKAKQEIKAKLPKHLEHINKMAAGIDVGSASHFVAVRHCKPEPPKFPLYVSNPQISYTLHKFS